MNQTNAKPKSTNASKEEIRKKLLAFRQNKPPKNFSNSAQLHRPQFIKRGVR